KLAIRRPTTPQAPTKASVWSDLQGEAELAVGKSCQGDRPKTRLRSPTSFRRNPETNARCWPGPFPLGRVGHKEMKRRPWPNPLTAHFEEAGAVEPRNRHPVWPGCFPPSGKPQQAVSDHFGGRRSRSPKGSSWPPSSVWVRLA